MTNKERTELREAGAQCMHSMENLFKEAMQKSDYDSAKYWFTEYIGGAKVLEALRLISCDEYSSLTDEMFDRWQRAKCPEAFEEEAG